jgi:hypothetical protein
MSKFVQCGQQMRVFESFHSNTDISKKLCIQGANWSEAGGRGRERIVTDENGFHGADRSYMLFKRSSVFCVEKSNQIATNVLSFHTFLLIE